MSVPWEGSLRLSGDVTVERYSDDEVWIVSASPALQDERFTLDLTGDGLPATVNVRVIDSTPVLVDGVIRHGLRLAIVRDPERTADETDAAVG